MRDSDKRKFKERIAKMYPSMGTLQLNELLPKEAPVTVSKLQPKDELISRGRDPIFFSHRDSRPAEEKGSKTAADELIPTCYALHAAPQALCRVVLVYPGLEKQVCRGADLFLPGVARPRLSAAAVPAVGAAGNAEAEEANGGKNGGGGNDDAVDGGGGAQIVGATDRGSSDIMSATQEMEELCLLQQQPWPVVLFGSPPVKKGELCCLASVATPWAPFAVGRFPRSCKEFELAGLTKGLAVEVCVLD